MKLKDIDRLCEYLETTGERFPMNNRCIIKDYCDYKTSVNSKQICVKHLYIHEYEKEYKPINKRGWKHK